MTTDPWNRKPTHLDWSEQVEEELQHGPLPQETQATEFPSLGEAAKTPTTKHSRKKKPVAKMSLGDFMSEDGGRSGGAYFAGGTRNMTDNEIRRMLPTKPREKDPNQPLTRNWNSRQGGFQRDGGRYEREDRGSRPPRSHDDALSSRADESKDWGADRRGGSRSYERSGSRSSSQGRYDDRDGHHGRDYDNWSRDNRFQSSNRHYDDRDRPRRGYGFHSGGGDGGGGYQRPGDDRWTPGGSSMNDRAPQGRPRLNLTKRTKPLPELRTTPEVAQSSSRDSVFGDAKPREEVLKDRATSSDVFSSKSDIASEKDFMSQPGSPGGGSYRGSSVSATESRGDRSMPHTRPREDPFGGARPRADPVTSARPHEDHFGAPGPRADPFAGAKPREDPFGGAKPREVVLHESVVSTGIDEEYKKEICSPTI